METNKVKRGLRKQRVGIVVSDKMNKTVVVLVERHVKDPIYKKVVTRSKKYMVHDEKNECQVGDKVLIMETRPLSKRKRWRVVEIIEKVK
ncbi:MAG: 30S ribosomal protein S17 [Bacteroidales bacterium]|nr:30S ribosomal protein S17 [Bacteroidales bacterium]